MRALFIASILACLGAGPSLAQTGSDVTRWDGATHKQYFGSPAEWARFQTLLTSEEFRDIRLATERETRVRIEGGDLVLTGCMMLACNSTRAGLSVAVDSGATTAVIWQRDREPQVFTSNGAALPEALRRLADTGALE
ncbi:MAG: hypothetical protein AAF415_08585 [Pseudomonadota bacterium]